MKRAIVVVALFCVGLIAVDRAGAEDNPIERIEALEAAVVTLQADLGDAQQRIRRLRRRVRTLEDGLVQVQANSVLTLNGYLSLEKSGMYPVALFRGLNIQLVNGVDQSTVNGAGNLIIGYDNAKANDEFVCSDGRYLEQWECEANAATWAVSHKTGSHNLIVGDESNYSSFGGAVLGFRNTVNRRYATVTGGRDNTASGRQASVSGGRYNLASGNFASVGGGRQNHASGNRASVSGGAFRSATDIDDWAAGSLLEDQ